MCGNDMNLEKLFYFVMLCNTIALGLNGHRGFLLPLEKFQMTQNFSQCC